MLLILEYRDELRDRDLDIEEKVNYSKLFLLAFALGDRFAFEGLFLRAPTVNKYKKREKTRANVFFSVTIR